MHEYDPRDSGPPMRSRGNMGPPRGMMPRSRGGYPGDEPRDHSPDMDHARRGRGGRGRGRPPMGERDYNGPPRGGADVRGRG